MSRSEPGLGDLRSVSAESEDQRDSVVTASGDNTYRQWQRRRQQKFPHLKVIRDMTLTIRATKIRGPEKVTHWEAQSPQKNKL